MAQSMDKSRLSATTHRRLARGVSLIEALVALAVMSFGMLALVGVQATMRYNSDSARQRAEALRIASDDLEGLRYFVNVATVPGQVDAWADIGSATQSNLALPGNTANTSFTLTRTVNTRFDLLGNDPRIEAMGMKVVQAQVTWSDRASANNQALLDTVVAGVSPALSARLTLPMPSTSPTRQRDGRHVSIPVLARNLGDGTSGFMPGNLSGVAWVINNTTGYVTQRCTGIAATQATLGTADLSNCITVLGRLVSGVVRYVPASVTPVTAALAENPPGPALPLDSATPLQFLDVSGSSQPVNQSRPPECVAQADLANVQVAYVCLVFPSDVTGWGGKLDLVPSSVAGSAWQIGTTAGQYQVCRYTLASSEFTANADHPRTYCRVSNSTCAVTARVTENLSNQNFLVIGSASSCPTDGPINPSIGDLVNSNTLPHQP